MKIILLLSTISVLFLYYVLFKEYFAAKEKDKRKWVLFLFMIYTILDPDGNRLQLFEK